MFFVRSFFHLVFHSVYDRCLCLLALFGENGEGGKKKRMEQQQIPLKVNNVNRSPFVIQGQRRNQIENFQVNEIVEVLDLSVSNLSCTFLMCSARAKYKCKLVVSRQYRYCCSKCFEAFRTDVVVCKADSTES